MEVGFARLAMPGRMELFPGAPGVVFDIAHNPDKAASLAAALRETFPDRHFVFVVAIGASKDAPSVLAPFFALPASFVFTSFVTAGKLAERSGRLADIAALAGFASLTIDDPLEALRAARQHGDGAHIVVVTGSTFVTSALRDWSLAMNRTPNEHPLRSNI